MGQRVRTNWATGQKVRRARESEEGEKLGKVESGKRVGHGSATPEQSIPLKLQPVSDAFQVPVPLSEATRSN